jgi:hypothetical protein
LRAKKKGLFVMDAIVRQDLQIPTTPEDLSAFVLVGREKLVSVRAEIRAIEKLDLAQEVRNQKREEAFMLSDALLDAEVRLGELLKQIPKADKGNQYTGKMVSNTGVANQKSKNDTLTELGISKAQAGRLEALAENKDLVEHVKSEARENDELPTRSAVLNLARARTAQQKQQNQGIYEDSYQYIDDSCETAKKLRKFLTALGTVQITNETLKMCSMYFDSNDTAFYMPIVTEGMSKLAKLQTFLKSIKM